MVKRPRPCPYCGEYGTGSPGEGCCGQTGPYTGSGSSPKESSSLPEIILGGALLFFLAGASLAPYVGLEKLVTKKKAAMIGGGISTGLYAAGIGTLIYLAEKKRRKKERENEQS